MLNKDKQGASSIDFADIDDDKDLDLFWGDFFSKSLYFLENTGTPGNPDIVRTYDVYPQNPDSIRTSGSNMPRFADIDNDSDLDLFVTVLFDPTIPQTMMFFRDEGIPGSPAFSKETEDYISTLDAGTKSIPAVIDIDGDGDEDLFIGIEDSPKGSIHFYENVNEGFKLIDTAYAGIRGDLSVAPDFGDSDGDGDFDLIVDDFLGGFTYYENTGNPQEYSFQKAEGYFGGIDVSDQSSPFLYDEDSDNDLDLYVGSRDGKTYFYENTGSSQNPGYQLVTETYVDGNFGKETSPLFYDIDSDGDGDLSIGNVKGGLYFFRNSLISRLSESPNSRGISKYLRINAFPNPFNSKVNVMINLEKKWK